MTGTCRGGPQARDSRIKPAGVVVFRGWWPSSTEDRNADACAAELSARFERLDAEMEQCDLTDDFDKQWILEQQKHTLASGVFGDTGARIRLMDAYYASAERCAG